SIFGLFRRNTQKLDLIRFEFAVRQEKICNTTPIARRIHFCNGFNVVTFVDVLREDRSSPAPGAEAALDQSAVAVESGFLFDQSTDFRFAIAHGLRKRAMPESLGMLEPGHRYFHDRRRSLHTLMRILRRNDSEAIRARRG